MLCPLQVSGVATPVLPNKTLQYTQQYAQAVLELGRQLQLPVVDLYSRLQAVHDWQTVLLSDGLHFTPAGSMAVWREMTVVLEQQMPHFRYGAPASEDGAVHRPPWAVVTRGGDGAGVSCETMRTGAPKLCDSLAVWKQLRKF